MTFPHPHDAGEVFGDDCDDPYAGQDAGARAASQRAVSVAGDPGPDSDRPYDHHHPNCYCRRCLAEKGYR